MKHYFLRDYVEEEFIKIMFVKTEKNNAEIWTKNMKHNTYAKHLGKFMKDMI